MRSYEIRKVAMTAAIAASVCCGYKHDGCGAEVRAENVTKDYANKTMEGKMAPQPRWRQAFSLVTEIIENH
jgi:hypothetical protein